MADVLVLCAAPAGREQVRRAVRRESAAGAAHTVRVAESWVEPWPPAALGVAFVDPHHAGRFAAA